MACLGVISAGVFILRSAECDSCFSWNRYRGAGNERLFDTIGRYFFVFLDEAFDRQVNTILHALESGIDGVPVIVDLKSGAIGGIDGTTVFVVFLFNNDAVVEDVLVFTSV